MSGAAAPLSPTTRRDEDPRLLAGLGAYAGDMQPADVLHMAFARSPYAHARLIGVDIAAAREVRGVVEVLVGADVAHLSHGSSIQQLPGVSMPVRPPLATDVVRWVGAPVAAVVATSRAAAADAVSLIEAAAEYELLPSVATAEAALASDAPRLFPERAEGNLAFRLTEQGGDYAALAAADGVLEISQRFVIPRLAAVPLETHAVLATFADERLTLHLSTQAPYRARGVVADALGLPASAVRIIAPDVGGAFGSKGSIEDEELLVGDAARRLGRPVRWVATRSEEFITAHHGRDAVIDASGLFGRDGTFLGLRVRALLNVGAEPLGNAINPALRVVKLLPGPYRLRAFAAEVLGVFTNTPPTGPYRGAGRPEATYIHERLLDLAALELDLSSEAIRRHNLLRADEFPYRSLGGLTYDSGDYAAALDAALEVVRGLPTVDDGRCRGVGLATYVEPSGGGFEGGMVHVTADGQVHVAVGSANHGQGHATVFRDLVARQLGVDRTRVSIGATDTDAMARGVGTFGARSLVMGGSALHRAGEGVIERGRAAAAELLEVSVADVRFENGRFEVAGVPERWADWARVASTAAGGVGLRVETTFDLAGETFGFGAYVALVAIDPDTGVVDVQHLVGIDDCGTIVNHTLATGQVHGGIAQGVGQALMERMVFDPDSAQVLSGSLLDYAAPRARNMPPLSLGHTVTPSPLNPLGAKGVGEAGTIGAPPAIANAVMHALRPFGVRHLDFPLTAEQVWRAIHAS